MTPDPDPGSPSSPTRVPWWRQPLVRWLASGMVVAVVAVFFWRTLSGQGDQWDDLHLSLGWWALWALLAFVAAVMASGWLWGRIVTTLDDRPVRVAEAVRVHTGAWLLKYVPGQVGYVLGKTVWASHRGRSRLMVLVSIVYEQAFLLLGSTVPMVVVLLVSGGGDIDLTSTVWLALAAVVPLAAVTHPAVFHRLVSALGSRVLRRTVPRETFLGFGPAMAFQAVYLVPRVLNGVGVMVIAAAVLGTNADAWLAITAAYAIAGAAGIVAVFVPSGLGVREAVFVALATPTLGVEGAIVVSIVARVLATIADGLLAVVWAALTGWARRNRAHPTSATATSQANEEL